MDKTIMFFSVLRAFLYPKHIMIPSGQQVQSFLMTGFVTYDEDRVDRKTQICSKERVGGAICIPWWVAVSAQLDPDTHPRTHIRPTLQSLYILKLTNYF